MNRETGCYLLAVSSSIQDECGRTFLRRVSIGMTDCDRIIEQLQARLQSPDARPGSLSPLLEHLAVCPRCQQAARTLVRALRLEAEDRLTCAEVEVQLPEYLLTQPGSSEWAELELHLAICPHCAGDYLELLALEQLTFQEPPVELPVSKPKLDFLPHRRRAASPVWSMDALGKMIVAFSHEALAALLAATPSAPALAVKNVPQSRSAGRLTLGGEPNQPEVILTLDADAGDPATYSLGVAVRIPGRGGWPNLAGTTVRASIPGRAELVRLTDAFGSVVITPLTLDEIASITLTIVPVA